MAANPKPTSEGPFVADFIESHCRLTRGERTGDLVKLLPFQRQLLDDLFELRADGRRRYRRAYIQIARKNSKTFLLACVSLYQALMGELGGEVYFVAGDRQQASRAFDEVRRIVEQDRELASLIKVYRQHMEIASSGTVLRVLSSDAGLQMGLSPSFVCFDEVAMQPTDRLWTTMSLGSGARTEPMTVGISTPGWERDSLAFRLYEHGKQVQSGEIEDPSFFFRSWEPADPECDYRDPEVWKQSNPALGPGGFLHEEDFVSTIATTPEHEFRRFRLGQWTATKDAALPADAWDACADPGRQVQAGEAIIVGFDGSQSRDCSALVGVTLDGFIFVINVWQPSTLERVDPKDVAEAIRQTCATYDVRAVICDQSLWTWVMLEMESERIPVLSEPQNAPRSVASWAIFNDAVLERRLTHDANPTLARHVGNLQLRSDRFGVRPERDRSTPGSFIDAAAASIWAYAHMVKQPAAPFVGIAWGPSPFAS